jgi:hypothetical protein
MKYAAIAALATTVAASKCDLDSTSWKLYSDKNCKKVDKKKQAKFGHVKAADRHLWSGDCETIESPQGKLGFKVECDSNGVHEAAWKNTQCKGDPPAM